MARSIKGHISSGINYKMLIYFGGFWFEVQRIHWKFHSFKSWSKAFLFIFQYAIFYFKFLLGGLALSIFVQKIIKILKFKKTESMPLLITEIFLKQNTLFLRDDKADAQEILIPFPKISIFHSFRLLKMFFKGAFCY